MAMFFRILNGIMALLFLLALAVQYNDPDPWRWVVIYLGAAVACILAVRRRLSVWLPAVLAVTAFAWAALLAPEFVGRVPMSELFREIGMDSVEIEVAREAVGLLLIGAWMIVLAVSARRRAQG